MTDTFTSESILLFLDFEPEGVESCERCDNPAKWIAAILPCGCQTAICQACRDEFEEYLKDVRYGRYGGFTELECAKCLEKDVELFWKPL